MDKIKQNIKRLLNNLTGIKLFKKKLPEKENIENILIISLYFAGDLLFHTAVLELLKKIYPKAKIDIWTRSSSSCLLENDNHLNKILIYDNIKTTGYRDNSSSNQTEYNNFITILKANKYNLIIDLTGKKSTAAAVKQIKPEYSIGLNYDYCGRVYDKFIYLNTASEEGHLIDKYLELIRKGLNINESDWKYLRNEIKTKPYIYPDRITEDKVTKILEDMGFAGKKYTAIHLTSGWKAKELPAKTFSEVINYLHNSKIEFIYIGDKNDLNILKDISLFPENKELDLVKYFANTDFKVSAEIIRRASLFIGSDSAPLHIAAAYEIPVIALFGPTNPGFSAPMGKEVKIIYHKLQCSASDDKQYCTRNGGFSCPYYQCMISITSDEIIEAVNKMWNIRKEIA